MDVATAAIAELTARLPNVAIAGFGRADLRVMRAGSFEDSA